MRDAKWPASKITDEKITRWGHDRLLPPAVLETARGSQALLVEGERTVILADQFRCGLSFPLIVFMHDVLGFYGI